MSLCGSFVTGSYLLVHVHRRYDGPNKRHCRRQAFPSAQQATLPTEQAPSKQQHKLQQKSAKAFAPATIANLGPGFDWMGCAVEVNSSSTVQFTVNPRCGSKQLLALMALVIFLFACMKGEGDIVIAEAMPDLPGGEVVIQSITGDDGRLPLVAANNCVGIAAIETIKLLGDIECGVALTLQKVGTAFTYTYCTALHKLLASSSAAMQSHHKCKEVV